MTFHAVDTGVLPSSRDARSSVVMLMPLLSSTNQTSSQHTAILKLRTPKAVAIVIANSTYNEAYFNLGSQDSQFQGLGVTTVDTTKIPAWP